MKNKLLFYITIIGVFSFNCVAQPTEITTIEKKTKKSNVKSSYVASHQNSVKEYHVEENINMKFGGYSTTYTVSDSSLINTTDLGPNNVRVVTPRFVKEEQHIDQPNEVIRPQLQPKLELTDIPVRDTINSPSKYATIVMIKTHERVAEKGYKSIDIFKKLGNEFYYTGDYDKAARWYEELFSMTTDLKPEFYYRYSHSLEAIGEKDKAGEMMKQFNLLSGSNVKD